MKASSDAEVQASSHQSCWWLQDHLEFGINSDIRVCCFQYVGADGGVRGSVPLVKITGNRFPAEEIRAARSLIHEEIAAGTHRDCVPCSYLQKAAWPPKQYLASKVTLNPWTHCNLKCVYCFTLLPQFTNKKVGYDIAAVIADMLAGRHLDPDGYVTWGGGDISALPEFNRVSQLFQDYGCRQEFKTSGFKFLRGVADALRRNLGVVEISLDAGTSETYASYKGRDAFDRVVDNARRYRECGPVRIKYIVDRTNVSNRDIEGFCAIVREIRPEGTAIAAEWRAANRNSFDADELDKIALLIRELRSMGVPFAPSNPEEGKVFFGAAWAELESRLG